MSLTRQLAPANPGNIRLARRHRLLLDLVAVGHRTQIADAGRSAPKIRSRPFLPPVAMNALLIAEQSARVQRDRAQGRTEGGHAGSAAERDIVVCEPPGRPDVPLESLLQRQVCLR